MPPATTAKVEAKQSHPPDHVRELVNQYGIRTPEYVIIERKKDLANIRVPFPVALKVCSPAILHKTDVGGVRLGIQNPAMLEAEYARMRRLFPSEKFVVEKMVDEGLEIIVGLVRDPTFGLCIMLGLGGIFAEALDDVVFRSVPITRPDAETMIWELKSSRVFKDSRGLKVDRNAIVDLLLKVSHLGCDRELTIDQFDLNPVIVNDDGLFAVDAKLISTAPVQHRAQEASAPSRLTRMLCPATVAVIGASNSQYKFGHLVMSNLLQARFRGRIFPVNPAGGEVLGLSALTSIREIEGPVDLAVVAIPATLVPGVVQECGEMGVGGVVIITGGFREAGIDGQALEEKLSEIVNQYRLPVIGPNCQGILNPHCNLVASIAIETLVPGIQAGGIALVTQSGSVGSDFLQSVNNDEIGLSAWVNLGNKVSIDESDILQYFDSDPHTTHIACYLESVADGAKFMAALKRMTKPIVLLKGGRTAAGCKAALSHTAALAGDSKVWDGVLRQHAVLHAESTEDLYDIAKGLAYYSRWEGNRLLIVESSGGLGTLACDLAERGGLQLLDLDNDTKDRLRMALPSHISPTNPLDVGALGPDDYVRAASMMRLDNFDAVLLIFGDPVRDASTVVQAFRAKTAKPIIVAFSGGGEIEAAEKKKILAVAPVYASITRAMRFLQCCMNTRSRTPALPAARTTSA